MWNNRLARIQTGAFNAYSQKLLKIRRSEDKLNTPFIALTVEATSVAGCREEIRASHKRS